MSIRDQIISGVSRLRTLLSSDRTVVSINGVTVWLEKSAGKPTATIPIQSIGAIDLERSWLRYCLVLQTSDGKKHSVGGLQHSEAAQIRDAILEVASRWQPEVCYLVAELAREIDGMLDGTRYIRRSESNTFRLDFTRKLSRCRGLVEKYLVPDVLTELHRLRALASPEAFESAQERSNGLFVKRQVQGVKDTVLTALTTQLTDEQAEAITTDEDATLVLAGAGTGKTAVIVGKAIHLVRNEGVAPDQVLVLAFNRKAAEEVRDRLPKGLGEARVSTCHAFGRHVITAYLRFAVCGNSADPRGRRT